MLQLYIYTKLKTYLEMNIQIHSGVDEGDVQASMRVRTGGSGGGRGEGRGVDSPSLSSLLVSSCTTTMVSY